MLKPSLVSNKWSRIAYLGRTLVLSLLLATPEVQECASLAIAPTKSSDLNHQWNLGFISAAPRQRWMKVWCLKTMWKSFLPDVSAQWFK